MSGHDRARRSGDDQNPAPFASSTPTVQPAAHAR
ncbi:MAG: hypothetical protein K0Q52_2971 [Microbacterium sp.]|jgi:hypothetical protein|nr:hypothetical protein [Microbacterium sp.]